MNKLKKNDIVILLPNDKSDPAWHWKIFIVDKPCKHFRVYTKVWCEPYLNIVCRYSPRIRKDVIEENKDEISFLKKHLFKIGNL